ncbi:M23 family metallopeptidase [Maricaulis sp.]|uniref:M23 family metallopeptidase n=1 Tax=Maricaulis sp. TaxID=1486257 RepID=UPI0026314BFB|nr:M23 family metallopeptidase [Maricaulis sp.]
MIAAVLALALQASSLPAEQDPIGDLIAAAGGDDEIAVTTVGEFRAFSGRCSGAFQEGGFLLCNYGPMTRVTLGDVTADADQDGWAALAIPRRAPESLPFRVEFTGAQAQAGVLVDEFREISQREYRLQRVDGVPQSTVTPDPSTLPRRQREYAQKQEAFNSTWDGQGFLDGFIAPADGRVTGVYGSARVYNNGDERGVHWGLDWANVTGTPVVAPASGLVTLAEPDMYYEGGLIFIDHGQGLVSAFLHLSAVHVEEGQYVEQGQLIGDIGAGGRSTGPHLDWRVKLRNQFYFDPQVLLDLDVTGLRGE